MGRGDCTFRQRDLKAAIKAASQSGAAIARVEVKPDGTIVVVLGDPPPTVPDKDMGTDDQWLENNRGTQHMNIAVQRKTQQVARPLKVLVPLIQEELIEGNEAGMEHYIKAGRLLNEVKDSNQVPYGSWSRWLKDNFHLGRTTAYDYMTVARKLDEGGSRPDDRTTIFKTIGREPRTVKIVTKTNKLKALFDVVDKVNVTRLADERQSRDDEIKLHRDMALQLIDLGYRAMATRLHPDAGGSRDAMSRLNTVRHELKEFAATRRFV